MSCASNDEAASGVAVSGRGDDDANFSRVPLAPSFFFRAAYAPPTPSPSTSTQVFHPVSAPGRGGALFRSDPCDVNVLWHG